MKISAGSKKSSGWSREMVELPLRYAEVFEKLGIEAPKGVLLYGPPGTGKTLIARAIASETKLHFIRVNGPEIIHKFYGESEARLREIFEEASLKAPSVIFIDEIDAIAPKRAEVLGDVEKRVVAQLLALMDGMVSRGHVIVIGATNIPEVIDPALRRPGRFDREVVIPVPNVEGRRAILKIHSSRMPLAPDVDLDRLAGITHAFVGADIEALCKEAGMVALRRYMSLEGENHLETVLQTTEALQITMDDFLKGLREVEPTATREFFTERSTVKWDDIGGLHKIKESLISIVEWPAKYPELFAAAKVMPPRGILFSGPSGTGKTLMAKALAGETGLNFITISVPILFSKWLGESEKALHQIFKKAKQSAPCILFFDEIDTLGVTRHVSSEGAAAVERVVSQFFNELDSLSDLSQVIVLGATNREDILDPALTRSGRLDYVIPFPVSDEQDRLEIFQVHLRDKPLGGDGGFDGTRPIDGRDGCFSDCLCLQNGCDARHRRIDSCPGERTFGEIFDERRSLSGGHKDRSGKGGHLSMLKEVRKKRAYEDIVTQIQDLIKKGRLKQGDQLPNEKELSETFKVSRSTVREAILSLETLSLVERRQGDGTYVIDSHEDALVSPLATALFGAKDDLIDIFYLRKIIEPEVAQIAAENATAEEIEELEKILREQEDEVTRGGQEGQKDTTFHHLLARMAKNRVLERLSLALVDLLSETRDEYLQSEERKRGSLKGHHRILDTIKAHNGRAARTAMLKHLADVEKSVFNKKRGGGKKSRE